MEISDNYLDARKDIASLSARFNEWDELLASPEKQSALTEKIIRAALEPEASADIPEKFKAAAAEVFSAFRRKAFDFAVGRRVRKPFAWMLGGTLALAAASPFLGVPDAYNYFADVFFAELAGLGFIVAPGMSMLRRNYEAAHREKMAEGFRNAMGAIARQNPLASAVKSNEDAGTKLVELTGENVNVETTYTLMLASRFDAYYDKKSPDLFAQEAMNTAAACPVKSIWGLMRAPKPAAAQPA